MHFTKTAAVWASVVTVAVARPLGGRQSPFNWECIASLSAFLGAWLPVAGCLRVCPVLVPSLCGYHCQSAFGLLAHYPQQNWALMRRPTCCRTSLPWRELGLCGHNSSHISARLAGSIDPMLRPVSPLYAVSNAFTNSTVAAKYFCANACFPVLPLGPVLQHLSCTLGATELSGRLWLDSSVQLPLIIPDPDLGAARCERNTTQEMPSEHVVGQHVG